MDPTKDLGNTASSQPPPAYDNSAAFNTGYVPDNLPNQPPAYVEKEQGSYPGGVSTPPPYVFNGAPSHLGPYPPAPPPGGFYQIASQQPIGYGMSADNPQAFVYVQPQPLTDPPNDYLGYSLFVTICCCWLVGLFAVAKSSECRTAIRLGNRPEAVLRSRQAKKYSHIALVLGIVSLAIAATIFGVYYGFMVTRYY